MVAVVVVLLQVTRLEAQSQRRSDEMEARMASLFQKRFDSSASALASFEYHRMDVTRQSEQERLCQNLHKIYTKFTQKLHNIYTTITQNLHKI